MNLKNKKVGVFGKVLLRFASAQVLSNFLRIISGFLIIRMLDPAEYGLYSGVGVYLGYILLGQGGVINGLSRELPYELGRGNDKYAKELASSTFAFSLLISFLAAFVFLIFTVYYFIKNEFLLGFIYVAYTLLAGLHLLNKQFLPTLYRTNKDFDALSKQNIRFGIGNLVSVIFVYFFNIYGLIIRGLVLGIYQFYLLFNNKPYQLEFQYNLNHIKKLFKTGIPIFMVGQITPLWSTIMNNIIFSAGGSLNYGLYSLSTIIQSSAGIIPSSFSSVIYPRMAIMLGQGKSLNKIVSSNVKPLIFQFLFMLFVAITGYYLLPFIIPYILPKYIDGVKAAQWMLFVPVVQSFGALNNIYNVVKKQKWYFVSLVIGAAIGSLFVLIKIKTDGFYLEVFPQGLILGKAIQQVLSFVFLKYFVLNGK